MCIRDRYEDNFKDYLQLMHDWYEKGYISPDFTSYTSERDAYLAGESGGYCGTSVDTFELAREIGLKIQNCPYLRAYEGQKTHGFYYLRPANGQFAVICSDSEHVPEAMMFMDYGYTLDGSYVYCYGIPEVAWVYGDDGLPKYTDYVLNNDRGYNITEVSYILRLHEGFPHTVSYTHLDVYKRQAVLSLHEAYLVRIGGYDLRRAQVQVGLHKVGLFKPYAHYVAQAHNEQYHHRRHYRGYVYVPDALNFGGAVDYRGLVQFGTDTGERRHCLLYTSRCV